MLALFDLQLMLAQMISGRRNESQTGQEEDNLKKNFFPHAPTLFLVSVGKASEVYQERLNESKGLVWDCKSKR